MCIKILTDLTEIWNESFFLSIATNSVDGNKRIFLKTEISKSPVHSGK